LPADFRRKEQSELNGETNRKPALLERAMRWLRPFLLAVVVTTLVYLVYRVGPEKILDTAKNLSPAWVGMALVFWAANLSLATLRFRSLAAPEMRFRHVLEVVMAGFLLNYASMVQGVGIGAKIGLMKGRRVPATRSLAASGGEVILDLLFTGLVTAAFAWYAGWGKSGMGEINPAVFVTAAMAAAVAGLGIIFFARASRVGARFLEGLRAAFVPSRMPLNFLYTAGVWTMGAASFYCMIRAAGETAPPLLTLAALSVGFVAGLISLVPGGLGVRDVTWAYIASIGGASMTVTATAAFAYRILTIVSVAMALGAWAIFRRGKD